MILIIKGEIIEMYISRNILIGIILLVLVFSAPFLYNAFLQERQKPEVSLDTPEIQELDVKKCIEDTEYMRANHMHLLSDWRIAVVREGQRIYVATDEQEYEMCMQETCLHCHSNKEEFCDVCHNYAGVELNCWECHSDIETFFTIGAK
jgi:cytochrome c